jgi:hypothetical protein
MSCCLATTLSRGHQVRDRIIIEQLESWLLSGQVRRKLRWGGISWKDAREAIGALEEFLADVSGDWKKPENRGLGCVVLSPPVSGRRGSRRMTGQ